MKKIIVIILCFTLCIMLAGCTQVSKSEKTATHTYAMILMPDGSIIKGEYSTYSRLSDNYATVKVDGVKYYLHEWRIVLWEK